MAWGGRQTQRARGLFEDLRAAYAGGASSRDLAKQYDLPLSAVRTALIEGGVSLRSSSDGVRLAAPKLGSGTRGRKLHFSAKHRENIAEARRRWSDENARGTSKKPSGYIEFTRGPNKGRGEHVVVMERRLGRRLLPDEVVHHIDRDRSNNAEDNLALMTRTAHSRLHRFEDKLEKGN